MTLKDRMSIALVMTGMAWIIFGVFWTFTGENMLVVMLAFAIGSFGFEFVAHGVQRVRHNALRR